MKKHLYLFLIILVFGCTKNEVENLEPIDDDIVINNETGDTISDVSKSLFVGKFITEVHATKGRVTVTEDASGVRSLNIQDLVTDSGPDLRLYLAEDKEALNFIELIVKPKNGSYSLVIPKDVDLKKHKFVLIWCRRFAVLFGSAELK